MTTGSRIQSELAFHDQQASGRSTTFEEEPARLVIDEAAYLDHETWVRPAMNRLGDVRGADVLDFGCGHGIAAVVLARRGARVTALDLSYGYLEETRARASANGVVVQRVQADGERLPFPDASFDRIWGHAVLHHLDVEVAGRELKRVLRPEGAAVFCEPWGENPLLNLARARLPYPGKHRTADEQPLAHADVAVLRKHFPAVEIRGFQLLSMARRVLKPGRLVSGLEWWDELLLQRVPALQNFCRYVVLTLRRER